MNPTQHAQARLQQRTIAPLVVDWLMNYGAIEYSHGARKHFFDKAALKRLKTTFGAEVVDRLGSLLDCYIVVGEGDRLITAAHRTRRIRRH
jgi:hypothetical protein